MIYLMQYKYDGSPTKIGYTWDDSTLRTRMRTFSTASAWPLWLLGLFEGDKGVEYDLHTEFSPFKMHGEWFRTDDPVREWISAVTQTDGADALLLAQRIMDLHYQQRGVTLL